MLENILHKSDIGRRITETHPSSAAVFASNGLLQQLTFLPAQALLEYGERTQGKKGTAATVGGVVTGVATLAAYAAVEAAARISETGVRYAAHGLEKLAGYAADGTERIMTSKQWIGARDALRTMRDVYGRTKETISERLEQSAVARKLKDAAVVGCSLLALYGAYGMTKDRVQTYVPPPHHAQSVIPGEARSPLPVDEIGEFQDIDDVLIYCNTAEQARDVPRRLPGVRRVTVRHEGQEIPRRHYDVINLRGHTGDMERLYDRAIRYRDDHVVVLFGGCNSTYFIPERATEEIALIGGQGSQETAYNNYVLRRTMQVLRSAQSWDDFRTQMHGSSQRMAAEFTMPGDERYVGNERSGGFGGIFGM